MPYSFTVTGTGTGNTSPSVSSVSSGSGSASETPSWGVNIRNTPPPAGVTETITLVIDGQALSWDVTGS